MKHLLPWTRLLAGVTRVSHRQTFLQVTSNPIDACVYFSVPQSKKNKKRKSFLADARMEAFVSVLSASPLPVVSREPRSGDERRRANKDEVVSRLVVALQRLPGKNKQNNKTKVSSSDGAGAERFRCGPLTR